MPTTTAATRAEAHKHVTDAIAAHPDLPAFDINGIVDELHQAAGHWDVGTIDETVYWVIVARHRL